MPNRPRITDLDEFTRLDQTRLTLEQLAQHYGCNIETVRRTRTRAGLNPRRPRVTPERLARVADRLADGWSHAEIARTEHIAVETIAAHFPGTAWTVHQKMRHAITASYYARMERKAA